MRIEMNRLLAYDDDSILDDLRRVAALMPSEPLTRAKYDKFGRADSSTVVRRLGGWARALERAGLQAQSLGKRTTDRMRDQPGRSLTQADVVLELQRIAQLLSRSTLRRVDLREHSNLVSEKVLRNRFGSWAAALEAAGLSLSARGRRWTDTDYTENLLAVWTHYGRPPTFAEMDLPPSRISSGAYAAKYGTWGSAKLAFTQQIGADLAVVSETPDTAQTASNPRQPKPRQEDSRHIPLGIRYQVLRRDRFRCVACGRSPATDVACVLHVDHVLAFARGGKTSIDNLQVLCESCNLGKGDR